MSMTVIVDETAACDVAVGVVLTDSDTHAHLGSASQ
jgi:hypothetical protein